MNKTRHCYTYREHQEETFPSFHPSDRSGNPREAITFLLPRGFLSPSLMEASAACLRFPDSEVAGRYIRILGHRIKLQWFAKDSLMYESLEHDKKLRTSLSPILLSVKRSGFHPEKQSSTL